MASEATLFATSHIIGSVGNLENVTKSKILIFFSAEFAIISFFFSRKKISGKTFCGHQVYVKSKDTGKRQKKTAVINNNNYSMGIHRSHI